MAGSGDKRALPVGAACPSKPHPLTPSPLRGEGERSWGDLAESEKTSISGPSLSTKWRGTEGEASEGRRLRGHRPLLPHQLVVLLRRLGHRGLAQVFEEDAAELVVLTPHQVAPPLPREEAHHLDVDAL